MGECFDSPKTYRSLLARKKPCARVGLFRDPGAAHAFPVVVGPGNTRTKRDFYLSFLLIDAKRTGATDYVRETQEMHSVSYRTNSIGQWLSTRLPFVFFVIYFMRIRHITIGSAPTTRLA